MIELFLPRAVLSVLVVFCWFVIAEAGEVRVSAAASMTEAIYELVRVFEGNHPAIKVRLNIGGSGLLAKQISQGAPVDLYISANKKWLDFLLEEGRITDDHVFALAGNSLVFVGSKKNGITELKDITRLSRVAMGSPRTVPAGIYAAQAMAKEGIYPLMQKGGQLVIARNVRQALLYAEQGEVDGAFVYGSDAMMCRRVALLFVVDSNLHDEIIYPAALTYQGVKNREAKMFYLFLQSKEAQNILERSGFKTVAR